MPGALLALPVVCSVPNLLRSPVQPVLGTVAQPLAHALRKGGAPALALMFNGSPVVFGGYFIVMGEQDAG